MLVLLPGQPNVVRELLALTKTLTPLATFLLVSQLPSLMRLKEWKIFYNSILCFTSVSTSTLVSMYIILKI